jgi:proteasome lid subunit RPN8/RPN11
VGIVVASNSRDAITRPTHTHGQSYVLPYREFRRLHGRALRAQQRDQSEVCGLVAVQRGRRLHLVYLRNHSVVPCKTVLDLRELRLVARNAVRFKETVLGAFHSHPIADAVPGRNDRLSGFFRGHELIYDVCGLNARLWEMVTAGCGRRRVKELTLTVERSHPDCRTTRRGRKDRKVPPEEQGRGSARRRGMR